MIHSSSAMDHPIERRGGFRRKAILPAAVGAIVVAAAVLAYPSASSWWSAERSFDASRLRFGAVTRGDLERDVSAQGRVVAAFHPTTSSPAAGIVSLKARAGDVVEKGAVLAVVDSPELNNRLEQERSRLSALESAVERQRIQAKQTALADQQKADLARVELEAARRAMDRATRTRAEGILDDVEYEKAQDDLRRTELELQHAEQNAALQKESLEFEVHDSELQAERQRLVVEDLRRQVGELSVKAPVAGLVSRLDVDEHDAVTTGQALVTVVDLSAFEIEVQVPEAYADDIAAGTPAVVTYSGREYAGEVRSISPEVQSNQVLGIVAFKGAAPEGLRQNQRVATRIVLDSRHDVLKVDRGPFLEAGGGRKAYVVAGDVVQARDIVTGATSVSEVEILSGLEEGDRIVISDTARFESADRVYLRR